MAAQYHADMELGSLPKKRGNGIATTAGGIVRMDKATTNAFDDIADMRRLGKEQAFKRNFHFASITAFAVITISGWVFVPSTVTYGLANGGTGGLLSIFLLEFFGLLAVVMCLAEMSSIAPTAGGQFHWASEFAPPKFQRIISYYSGWLASIAWLSGVTGGMYIAGFTIQGIILLTNPTYTPHPYQGFLFVVMISTTGLLVNSLLARYLPKVEGVVMVLFCLAFLVFLCVFWVLPPHLTASEVFQTFQAGDGWSSLGLAMLSSQSNILFVLLGADTSAHMSEETKDAGVVIPRAMVWSYVINGAFAYVFAITYCFLLVDYGAAEKSPTGFLFLPFLQVYANAVNSVRGGAAIASILVVLQIFGTINYMATCSRQIFAFARDGGLPFRTWIAKVDSLGTYPINAVLVVWALVILESLITLGSTVAFDAINSLTILALLSTYLISLTCMFWRRCFGGLPESAWALGRAGLPLNIIGMVYCVFIIIFLPWPVAVPVNAANFNWASVMFVGIMAIATVYFFLFARKVYTGPVKSVRPRGE